MLEAGSPIPDARVWAATGEGPVTIGEAVAGDGYALLCFYFFDWSPG